MGNNTVLGLILCLVLIGAFSFVVYKKWSNRTTDDQAKIQTNDPDGNDPDPSDNTDDHFGRHKDGHKGSRHDSGGSFGDRDGNRQPFGSGDETTDRYAQRQSHGGFGSERHADASEPFSEFDQHEPAELHQQSEPGDAFGDDLAESHQQTRHQHHQHEQGNTFFEGGDDQTDPFGGQPQAQNVSVSTAQNMAPPQSQSVPSGGDFEDPFGDGDATWQEPVESDEHAQSGQNDQFADDAFGRFEPAHGQQQSEPDWEQPAEQAETGQPGDDAFGLEHDEPVQETTPPPTAGGSWEDGFGDSFADPADSQEGHDQQYAGHGQHGDFHEQRDHFGQDDQFQQHDQFDQGETFAQQDDFEQDDQFVQDGNDGWNEEQTDASGAFDDWPVDGGSFSGRDFDAPHSHRQSGDPFADNNPNHDGMTADEAGHAVYVVQPSDNFWSISKKQYGTARYYKALSHFNQKRIPDPTKMRPGMKVLTPSRKFLEAHYVEILPKVSGLRQVGGEIVSSHRGSSLPAGFFRDRRGRPMYRIGRHDTLSAIAQRHLGRASRWIQIYALNRQSLPTPHELTIGTELYLPADASQVQLLPDHQETR